MGKFPEAKIRIQSEFHFPGINSNESFPSTLPESKSGESDDCDDDETETSISYSKMIRDGKRSQEPPIILRDESFPAPSWGLGAVSLSKATPYSKLSTVKKSSSLGDEIDSDGEMPTDKPAEKITMSFDMSNATAIVKGGKKKKKKGKAVLMLQTAPRPQMN